MNEVRINCRTCKGRGDIEFESGMKVRPCPACRATGRDAYAERDALAAELENLTAKHKVALTQLETSLRANEQLSCELETMRKDASAEIFLTLTAELAKLRAELAAIKGKSGFDYSIRTQSTNRIPVPSQEIHFNSKDQLPPVDTPLLVLVDNQVVRARRPNFVERKGADLEFILVDGRTISGRLPWTYP